MAEKVLSQDEVDALMKGVSAGDVETESDKDKEHGEGSEQYDLVTSKERVVRGKLPTLEIINEQFCRNFRLSLFNLVRKVADVTVEGVGMMKYADYISGVTLPASFNVFQISPLRGVSLLVVESNLIFIILDNYFGGTGRELARVEGREFTVFEQRVIRKITDRVFTDMQISWKPIFPLEFIYNRSEMSPQFVNVVVPTEIVVISTFLIEIEGRSSTMSMCIPYSSMEPIKDKLYATYQSDSMDADNRWSDMMEHEVRKSELNISAVIGSSKLSIEELLNLDKGDIIMLDSKTGDPASVNVEGTLKFTGTPGLSGNSYAIKILEMIEKEGE